uniref:VWFA domain-containing protein n=1 Tax=Meloidogyne javanica TaxID=6303 RepID=A0A915LQM3_MELJA
MCKICLPLSELSMFQPASADYEGIVVERCQPKVDVVFLLDSNNSNDNIDKIYIEHVRWAISLMESLPLEHDAIRVAAAKYLGFPLTEFSLGENIRQKLQFQQTFKTGQKELPQLRESILTEAERARACSRIGDEAFNGQRRNGPSTNQQNIGKISNGGAFALAENRDRLNNNIGESNDNNFGAEAFLQQRLKGNENTQIEEEFNNKMSQNSKQDEKDISIDGEQALLFNNAAAFKIPSLINADELDVFDPLENSKPNSQIRRPFTGVTINSITTPSLPISRYRPILVKVELPVAIAQRLRPTPSIEFFFEFNNEGEQQQNKQLLKSNSMLEMINKIKKINREEAEKSKKEEVRHITGTTYIGQALKQALKLLEERRRQVPIIVILLSDGFSQDDAIKQAEAIRNLPNLQFYALSIGELSNIELLHRLVDNPSHVFIGNEASELLRSQLLRRIRCNK